MIVTLTVNIRMGELPSQKLTDEACDLMPRAVVEIEQKFPDVFVHSATISYTVSEVDGMWMAKTLLYPYFSDDSKHTTQLTNIIGSNPITSSGVLTKVDVNELRLEVTKTLLKGKLPTQSIILSSVESFRKLDSADLDAIRQFLEGLEEAVRLLSFLKEYERQDFNSTWIGFSLS